MLHSGSVPRTSICPLSLQRPCFRLQHAVPATLHVSASLPDNDNRFKVEYTPWLIVGLGNPGNKYHGTRHNVGFEMIERISQAEGILLNTIQSKALIGIGCIGEVPLVLAKPQAYMNFSGESVAPLAAYYRIPLRHILLVYDEMRLPNGVMRLQPKGGHGQHSGFLPLGFIFVLKQAISTPMKLICGSIGCNWLFARVKSVMAHLDGCREFPRLSIGIGNPPGAMDVKAFLLQKFSSVERQQIDEALDQGVQAVRALVLNGFSQRISRFNLGQKYKYHKV